MEEKKVVRVALAGNPNCGKTSIFNALTGARQRVANYPGVTVEKREGRFVLDGREVVVLDLPGTYSLSSLSPEEKIAEQQLIDGNPDVTVVVADSTNLHRSLVLLAQVMQLGANPVLCLNMADEARAAGQELDQEKLEALLGFPVVQTVGHRGEGIEDLKKALKIALEKPVQGSRLVLGGRLEAAVYEITQKLDERVITPRARRWAATRLLAGDKRFIARLDGQGAEGRRLLDDIAALRRMLEAHTGREISLYITERYFGFVDGLLREVILVRPGQKEKARAMSDLVDNVLAHKVLGLPVFFAVMYGIFWLTFSVGEYPMQAIEWGFDALTRWMRGLWGSESDSMLQSLLVDGVMGGVSAVVVFLPNILLLFLGVGFLEDTGYMARAAFLVDKFMHCFGLHGKSFIPMMTGFGCSIPAIMGTRILENERDRLTTILVLPLVPCGGRLLIWLLLIPAFLPLSWRAPMLWFIYFFGSMMALLLALVLRKTVLAGDDAPFVMELPPYRMPTLRGVVTKTVQRAWLYLRKAGTVILGISIVLWLITSYPKPDWFPEDRVAVAEGNVSQEKAEALKASEALEYSVAGRLGKALEPVLSPLGFDWRIAIGLVGAFAAKEVFVSQMGIVFALGETGDESEPLREKLAREYSPVTGVSLILFNLIASPCMATLAVTRRESGSWKWALLQFGGLTVIAYFVSLVVYQVGTLLLS